MKRLILTLALSTVVALPAAAQWPAGTPRDDQGSPPSPSGNPAPQEEVETRRDHQGRLVTEDGKPVRNGTEEDADSSEQPDRHSAPGGPNDDSTSPGSIE
ncbi:hypothetical protein [Pseudomonas oligotrophica]|uniref:hypothetical protein n=1 Tax=Pseudomonas oligotrophica TaxID=2912055 RepID=UPI001F3D0AB4|nr:hypothetical protein [Pseudomonas oligotrophica]MCF7202500.1 hypothetical protein [Pseudomonas oligotrophica]